MVTLGNVENTNDADKPVSNAQQTALDLKAPIANPTFTGTVGGITKSMVTLGNVENTALSTWGGTSNITSVGTITTGVWQGTPIAVNKGGTGAITDSGARTALGVDTYVLTTMLDDISTESSCFVVAPKTGTIKKIYSVINGTITDDDAVITINVNGGTDDITNKLTIAQAGSTVGDVDTVEPDDYNTVSSGQYIKLTTDAGSTGAVRAIFTIEITLA